IDFPGAVVTTPFDINNHGQIVGVYSGLRVQRFKGFLFNAGKFRTIVPSGALSTQLNGINDVGDIVGAFTDLLGFTYPFVYTQGRFVRIHVPGTCCGDLRGVNDRNQVVGAYGTAQGLIVGFALYNGNKSLVSFPGSTLTQPLGINVNSDIVGDYT